MKLLFIGESWHGSCARSIKEGLRRVCRSECDQVDELNEDLIVPIARGRWLRAVNRLLAPGHRRELAKAILEKSREERPDAVIIYKGSAVGPDVVRDVRALGALTVNIFPDYSPHAYGVRLREAIGEYDLVASTKRFHPQHWRTTYGYRNECVFVPHGYDPMVHLRTNPQSGIEIDVGMVATWRPEYHSMMMDLGRLLPSRMSVAIAGSGWREHAQYLPSHWRFPGPISGLSYSNWARRCGIMIAPLNTEVIINGRRQPGDEDTSRTYELAAAQCFFVHRRTDYVRTLYDERKEVPLFDDPRELADLLTRFVDRPEDRVRMAAAAHRRAVPAYSTEARAGALADLIRDRLATSRTAPSAEQAAP